MTTTLQLPSGRINLRTLGPEDGPPVLFVHGVLVDSRLWDPVAVRLAGLGFRCYLPDLPLGAHRTPLGNDDALSPPGVARLLLSLLADQDLADVTLVGNDTGGALCQYLLDLDSSRIGRVVLTNCDAFTTFPPFPFSTIFRLARHPSLARALLAPMGSTALRHSPVGFGLLLTDPDPALTATWLAPARTDRRILRETSLFLRGVDPRELDRVSRRMTAYDGPVSLVWGMRDKAFAPRLGRGLAATFPHARFVEVPGARTFVPQDAPDAVVAEVVAIQDRAIAR